MKELVSIDSATLAQVSGGRTSRGSQTEIKAAIQATSDAVKDLVRQGQTKSSSSDSMLPMMMVMMMRR